MKKKLLEIFVTLPENEKLKHAPIFTFDAMMKCVCIQNRIQTVFVNSLHHSKYTDYYTIKSSQLKYINRATSIDYTVDTK